MKGKRLTIGMQGVDDARMRLVRDRKMNQSKALGASCGWERPALRRDTVA